LNLDEGEPHTAAAVRAADARLILRPMNDDPAIRTTASRYFAEAGFNPIAAINAVRRDTTLGVIRQAEIVKQIALFTTGDPIDRRCP
jgi:hypothetical protein